MSCIIFVFCRRNLAKLLKQQQAESANDKDSTTSDSTLAPDAANEHTSTKSVENGVSKKSASKSLVSSSKHTKGSSNGELVSGRMSRRESEFEFVDLQENPETEIYYEEGSLEQAGKSSRYMYQKSNLVGAIETTTKAQTTETGSDKTTLLINNTKVTAEVIEPRISRPATLAIPGSAAVTKESVAASKLSVVYAEPVKMRNCATTPRSGTDNRKTFVAMYPIGSTSDGQLDLAINDVIFFMEEEQDGWLKGEKKETGEVGWFPKTHVREGVSKLPDTAMFESPCVSTPTSTPATAAAAAAAAASSRTSYVLQKEESIDSTDEEFEEEETCGVECLAVYPYQALQDGDLSFEAGDVVFVVEMNENGWWKGYHGDEEGFFPGSYVQIMPNNDQSTVDGSLLQSEFNLTKSEMRLSAESPEEVEPLTLKQKRKMNNKTISKFFSKRLTHLNPSLLFAKSTGEVKTKQLRKKKRRKSQTAIDRSQAPEPPALPGSAAGDDSPAKSKALMMDIVGQIADKHKRKDGGLKAATPTDQTASLTTKPDAKPASKTKESKTKDGSKMKASKKSSKPTIAQLFKHHPPSSEYDDSNSNIGNASDHTATDVNGFNSGVYANLDEFVNSSDTSPTSVDVTSSQTGVHSRGGTAHLFVKNSRLSRSTENLTSIGDHLDVWKPNKADAPDHRLLKPLPPQKPQKQKGNGLNSDDQSGMSRTTSFPDLIRAEVVSTPTTDQPLRTKPQPPLKKPVLGGSNAGARRVSRNKSMNAVSSELVVAKPQPLTKKPKLPQMTSTNHFQSEIALSAGRSDRIETEEEFPSLLRSKRDEEILEKRLKRSNSDRSSVKPNKREPEIDSLEQHQTEVIRFKVSPSLEDFAKAKFGEESFA